MTKIHKLGAYLLIGTLTFAAKASIAQAAETPIPEEPVAGINLVLDELFENTDHADKVITKYFENNVDTQNANLAFAQVSSYVNIRSRADENSDIVGKLYDNSAATILGKKDGWYDIQSGSVKGYIKGEFLATGDQAAKLAKTVGNRVVTISTKTLKVRDKNSLDSQVLDLVAEGDNFEVLKEMDGWVKISLGGNKAGYVSKDYVKVDTVYEEAVSIEEEQARLEEEQAANNHAEDNTVVKNTSVKSSSPRPTTSNSSNSTNTSKNNEAVNNEPTTENNSGSSLGSQIAAFALQFEGNPYVWGGTSLTNGADCSGFTQSLYSHFGIGIPRTSRTQATGGRSISISNLQPGDLIFYAKKGRINHVALYIGSGRVIGASSPSTGIRISNYNYRTPVKAVRYIN